MSQNEKGTLSSAQKEKVSQMIREHAGVQGSLIRVLHETQEYLGYVPYEAQNMIATGLGVPLAEVYSVVTFYSRFTLNPVGKYKVGVCLGTACYVKGSEKILEEVKKSLALNEGETSSDGLFSIEATRCIGACGLAPVIMVNDDVYGKLTPEEIPGILEKYTIRSE